MKKWPLVRVGLTGLVSLGFGPLSTRAGPANAFVETDLVSDIPGRAALLDPNLSNPWGLAASATSPFWVADNGTGVSSLYNGAGTPQALVVTVPPPSGGTPPAAPTGVVFNGGTGFEVSPGIPARFLFATEEGTVSGWNPSASATQAIRMVDNSGSQASYKGLAIGNNGAGDFLYAADFHRGRIDVFDSAFGAASLPGTFTDPILPSGYAPFNIQKLGGQLYVTYALQDGAAKDDVAGAGHGFVNAFDLDGNFLRRVVSQGVLDSPWGLALAPASFGPFANDLLVGNFGDGRINAFDPVTGAFIDNLDDPQGNPLSIEGLWALVFGNGGNGGSPDTLYFTAGIAGTGAKEDHGLFGSLAPGELVTPVIPESAGARAIALAGALLGWLHWHRRRGESAAGPR